MEIQVASQKAAGASEKAARAAAAELEIEQTRGETLQEQLSEAMSRIDGLLADAVEERNASAAAAAQAVADGIDAEATECLLRWAHMLNSFET